LSAYIFIIYIYTYIDINCSDHRISFLYTI